MANRWQSNRAVSSWPGEKEVPADRWQRKTGGGNTNRWEKGMRKRLIGGKRRRQLAGGKGGKRARQAGERGEGRVTSRWQREKEGRIKWCQREEEIVSRWQRDEGFSSRWDRQKGIVRSLPRVRGGWVGLGKYRTSICTLHSYLPVNQTHDHQSIIII
jgi:hypothetical protein